MSDSTSTPTETETPIPTQTPMQGGQGQVDIGHAHGAHGTSDRDHERDDGINGPFRYKEAVRCIAIIDICIAFFMLTFLSLRFFSSSLFYRQLYPKELFTVSNDSPNIFSVVTIALILIYAMQLGMAQLLLSATYQTDIDIIMSRCQKWYWFSIHLNVVLGIELLLLIFAVRDDEGGKRFPIPAIVCLIKMIFRSTGNHLIKLFIWDIRTRNLTFPGLGGGGGVGGGLGGGIHSPGSLGSPYPFESSSSLQGGGPGGGGGGEYGNLVSIPKYEHPPTYEEAMKEKPPYFQEYRSTSTTGGSGNGNNDPPV